MNRMISSRLAALLLRAALTAFIVCAPARAGEHHWRLSISGTPATSVTAGQSYAFAPQESGARWRTPVFAIANKPSWASFSTSTGALTGTPPAASVGSYANIVIAVSDGVATATLPAFTVQVLTGAAASPPVISGTPATTDLAGAAYTFQPSATDPSGLTLAFSVQNKPAWASFSIATGQLSGTPASTQTGVYPNIVISASDGQHSAALPPFSITVSAAPAPAPTTGNAVLALTAPTQNTNGSPLTDLAGYNISYGTSSAELSQTVQITDPTVTTYTVSNLAAGTWYFAATAYTTAGTQSAPSATVSKVIP